MKRLQGEHDSKTTVIRHMGAASLGLGLPAFVLAMAALRLGRPVPLHWVLFVLAALLCTLILLPWIRDGVRFGSAIESLARPRLWHGAELSLVFASLGSLRSIR